MREQISELQVIEGNGTARGGKGTILDYLGKKYPNVTTDETGADYRALTLGLIENGTIEPGMPTKAIQSKLAQLSFGDFFDLAQQRQSIIDNHGRASLYTPEVSGTVSRVAPFETVRKAVKAGFRARVEAVRDAGEFDVLAVDGRNLAPVIESIRGTNLLLRTFISCSPFEAAWRECDRLGIELDSAEGKELIASITRRNAEDADVARRGADAVRPDTDAIDYWFDAELLGATIEHFAATLYGGDYNVALSELFINQQHTYKSLTRFGAGTLAVTTNRQINFDTTPFKGRSRPKEAMLEAVDTIYQEALEASRTFTSIK